MDLAQRDNLTVEISERQRFWKLRFELLDWREADLTARSMAALVRSRELLERTRPSAGSAYCAAAGPHPGLRQGNCRTIGGLSVRSLRCPSVTTISGTIRPLRGRFTKGA